MNFTLAQEFESELGLLRQQREVSGVKYVYCVQLPVLCVVHLPPTGKIYSA